MMLSFFVAAACGSEADEARQTPRTAATQDPCAGAGCALPPVCGVGCTARCGCCSCADGQTFPINGRLHVCKGGCFEPVTDDGSVARDAGPDTSEPIDCSNVGCAPPTACDEACTAPCGCCRCADGET